MTERATVEAIANNVRIGMKYAEALVSDVPPPRFSRFAAGTRGPIESNHPAWIIGHLALYPGRAASMLELEADVAVPSDWEDLFGPKSICVDDDDASRYPSRDELVGRFMAAQNSIAGAILRLDDASLARETPLERYRQRFPTLTSAVDFLLTTHAMFHLGQLSAWRRSEGLGPAM
ncbi:MAG: DinB family protein [Planctomycetota bacterium]